MGRTPYNIPSFVINLLKNISSEMTFDQLKEISNSLTLISQVKKRQEKEEEMKGKKKSKKIKVEIGRRKA